MRAWRCLTRFIPPFGAIQRARAIVTNHVNGSWFSLIGPEKWAPCAIDPLQLEWENIKIRSEAPEANDRRASSRKGVSPVRLTIHRLSRGGLLEMVQVINVSDGGMRIKAQVPFELNEAIQIAFGGFLVMAEVVYCHTEEEHFLMGLKTVGWLRKDRLEEALSQQNWTS